MKKDELVQLSKNLMMEVLYARSYRDILVQYRANRTAYKKEISLSPAFYSISETALIEALSIRIARLYDADGKSAGLGYLMEQAEAHKEFFPKDRGEYSFESDGEVYKFNIPLQHTLRECEKCYFKDRVAKEEVLLNLFSNTNGDHLQDATIEVTVEELLDMYHKRFASIKTICKKLREQRNKIYAHNDRDVNFDLETIYRESPLSYQDIDVLLEFAEDYTAFCYEYLSGNYAALEIKNRDDWENTLVYAQKGIACQRREWKEKYREDFELSPKS